MLITDAEKNSGEDYVQTKDDLVEYGHFWIEEENLAPDAQSKGIDTDSSNS